MLGVIVGVVGAVLIATWGWMANRLVRQLDRQDMRISVMERRFQHHEDWHEFHNGYGRRHDDQKGS